MFQFNIRHLARTWAGRRKKNWYENQKLPLKGISRIQRRDIDKVLVSNPESRERKRIDETPSRGGGGEGGGVFFAPPIGKFHLIWKVSDCSNGRVAELPVGRGCSPLTRRGFFPASSRGGIRYPSDERRENFHPLVKNYSFVRPIEDFSLTTYPGDGAECPVKFIKLLYRAKGDRPSLSEPRAYHRSSSECRFPPILNLPGQFDPP